MTNSLLALGSGLLMTAYMANVMTPFMQFSTAVFVKAAPIVLLAIAVFFSRGAPNPLFRSYCAWIAVGLLFCSAGDVFLDLQDFDKSYFLPGLGSFLVGHICYVVGFSIGTSFSSFSVNGVPLVLAAGGMYVYLLPSLPADLKIPVAVYCTAIALMGVKAIGRPHKHFKSSGINMGVGGALLFVISDSVLSFALFKGGAHDRQAFKLVVMATYYGAQMLIALSACDFISGAKPAPKQD